jgi:3',5'-nucleoside bisphosphate phosphatase
MNTWRELNADLHAHSCISDGVLTPTALIHRAHTHGVQLFALTDHDELAGLAEAQAAAEQIGLRFVPGVEISVTWAARTVHMVGLGIDTGNGLLQQGLAQVRSGRQRRALQMAAALQALGIEGSYDGALSEAGNPALISRTHFARYLVKRHICTDMQSAFNKYLAEDQAAYVPQQWAQLSEAVAWVHAAGGVAVIAHPGRYKFGDAQMWSLLSEFKALGGNAIEVATANHSAAQLDQFAALARHFNFEASRGSDFHAPGESRVELGAAPALPRDLTPVWMRLMQ